MEIKFSDSGNIYDDDYMTIKQVAQLLECSEKTIRNRIAKGEILADKIKGPYGEQYCIPRDQFEVATTVQDVVTIDNTLELKQFGSILSAMLEEQNRKVLNELEWIKEQLFTMDEENKNLKTDMKKLQENHYKELDNKLIDIRERMIKQKEKKGFFARLFSSYEEKEDNAEKF